MDYKCDVRLYVQAAEGMTHHRINEFYFLPKPSELIFTHLPDKPEWQLLKKPVTLKVFQQHFYIRERFHILGLGISPRSHIPCVVTTTNGEIGIEFSLQPINSAQLRFKHMLYVSRVDIDCMLDTFLDRFVLFEHRKDLICFSLRFPVKGTFKFEIYGLNTDASDIFDLCCSYVIECPRAMSNCLPFPDCPPLGWGPVQKTKEAGLTPVSHKTTQIVAKNGYVEVKLDRDKLMTLYQQLKHAVLDDTMLSNYSMISVENGQVVVYLRLPQEGEK